MAALPPHDPLDRSRSLLRLLVHVVPQLQSERRRWVGPIDPSPTPKHGHHMDRLQELESQSTHARALNNAAICPKFWMSRRASVGSGE